MPAAKPLAPIADQPLTVVLLAAAGDPVEAVVADWFAFLQQRRQPFDVLLVLDGVAEPSGLGERFPRLKAIRHETALGEGASLKAGLDSAETPLIFYTLCRPEYKPADLLKLLDKTMDGPDGTPVKEIDHVHLMTGYRAGDPVPPGPRLLGAVWRLLGKLILSYDQAPLPGWLGPRRHLGWLAARVLFGLRHGDVTCPFRLLRREALPRLRLQSAGPFAHVELLAKSNFLGHQMSPDVPIDVKPGPYRGDAASFRREGMRVFAKPDFGPAILPA